MGNSPEARHHTVFSRLRVCLEILNELGSIVQRGIGGSVGQRNDVGQSCAESTVLSRIGFYLAAGEDRFAAQGLDRWEYTRSDIAVDCDGERVALVGDFVAGEICGAQEGNGEGAFGEDLERAARGEVVGGSNVKCRLQTLSCGYGCEGVFRQISGLDAK